MRALWGTKMVMLRTVKEDRKTAQASQYKREERESLKVKEGNVRRLTFPILSLTCPIHYPKNLCSFLFSSSFSPQHFVDSFLRDARLPGVQGLTHRKRECWRHLIAIPALYVQIRTKWAKKKSSGEILRNSCFPPSPRNLEWRSSWATDECIHDWMALSVFDLLIHV